MKLRQSQNTRFLFCFLLLMFFNMVEAKIIKCEDHNGRTIYTDSSLTDCQQLSKPLALNKKKYTRNIVKINPYTGNFKDNPVVIGNIAKIRARADIALQKTLARLGIESNLGKIEIYFTDKVEKVRSFSVITYTAKTDDKQRSIILFNTRRLLLDSYDIEKKLVHEFTHAIFRDLLKERHRQLPKWFREGLAVWTAGQLEEKMTHLVSVATFSNDKPLGLLNGIESEKHNLDDYLEDGLFFDYIEKKYGEAFVKNIAQAVLKGTPYIHAFESVLGGEWNKLKIDAADYSLKTVKQTLKQAHYEEYISIKKVNKTLGKDWAKRKANYEKYINKYPNSILKPNALYQLGKVSAWMKDYSEARRYFNIILDQHSHYGSLPYNSIYYIGEVYVREGNRLQAEAQFDYFLDVFPDSKYRKIIQKRLKNKQGLAN